jgi:hypothetical protein
VGVGAQINSDCSSDVLGVVCNGDVSGELSESFADVVDWVIIHDGFACGRFYCEIPRFHKHSSLKFRLQLSQYYMLFCVNILNMLWSVESDMIMSDLVSLNLVTPRVSY